MSPYVGEIRMFAGDFAPAGWMFCQGQLVPISEYESLFNLIGTIYGGDGQETFGLPDLRGRVPIHTGGLVQGVLGQLMGVETVTLTVQQIPAHSHSLMATTSAANTGNPQNAMLADVSANTSDTGDDPSSSMLSTAPPNTFYTIDEPSDSMAAQSVSNAGGNQPHDNRMPYVTLNYIISLFGIYPAQT